MFEYLSAFTSGLLSVLSPCILPMLPIILANALQAGKKNIAWLPLGLASCFTLLGVGSHLLLQQFNLAQYQLQIIAAYIFVAFGVLLLVSSLQNNFNNFLSTGISNLFSGFLNFIHHVLSRLNLKTAFGQFLLGFLLAITWTPCVGPALGVAMGLAASGERLFDAALMMFLYSIGICVPIIALAYLIQNNKNYKNYQQKILQRLPFFKLLFAGLLIFWGLMVIFAWDKMLSAFLLKTFAN